MLLSSFKGKKKKKERLTTQRLGKYEIIDGNRRKRCAELLEWATVPCRIREMTDEEAYETAFIINNDRRDLDPLEQGRWLQLMMATFPKKYPTQEALAKYVGLSRSRVAQLIIYYEKETKPNIVTRVTMENPSHEEAKPPEAEVPEPEEIPEPESSPAFHNKVVTEGVSRQIRTAPPEYQDQLRKEALELGYTVRQTMERAQEFRVDASLNKIPEKYREEVRKEVERAKRLDQDPVGVHYSRVSQLISYYERESNMFTRVNMEKANSPSEPSPEAASADAVSSAGGSGSVSSAFSGSSITARAVMSFLSHNTYQI